MACFRHVILFAALLAVKAASGQAGGMAPATAQSGIVCDAASITQALQKAGLSTYAAVLLTAPNATVEAFTELAEEVAAGSGATLLAYSNAALSAGLVRLAGNASATAALTQLAELASGSRPLLTASAQATVDLLEEPFDAGFLPGVALNTSDAALVGDVLEGPASACNLTILSAATAPTGTVTLRISDGARNATAVRAAAPLTPCGGALYVLDALLCTPAVPAAAPAAAPTAAPTTTPTATTIAGATSSATVRESPSTAAAAAGPAATSLAAAPAGTCARQGNQCENLRANVPPTPCCPGAQCQAFSTAPPTFKFCCQPAGGPCNYGSYDCCEGTSCSGGMCMPGGMASPTTMPMFSMLPSPGTCAVQGNQCQDTRANAPATTCCQPGAQCQAFSTAPPTFKFCCQPAGGSCNNGAFDCCEGSSCSGGQCVAGGNPAVSPSPAGGQCAPQGNQCQNNPASCCQGAQCQGFSTAPPSFKFCCQAAGGPCNNGNYDCCEGTSCSAGKCVAGCTGAVQGNQCEDTRSNRPAVACCSGSQCQAFANSPPYLKFCCQGAGGACSGGAYDCCDGSTCSGGKCTAAGTSTSG